MEMKLLSIMVFPSGIITYLIVIFVFLDFLIMADVHSPSHILNQILLEKNVYEFDASKLKGNFEPQIFHPRPTKSKYHDCMHLPFLGKEMFKYHGKTINVHIKSIDINPKFGRIMVS